MPVIAYECDADPTESGVYACRVPMDGVPGFLQDRFLMWLEGAWSYPGSDQKYRGPVIGWIGPLQRRL